MDRHKESSVLMTTQEWSSVCSVSRPTHTDQQQQTTTTTTCMNDSDSDSDTSLTPITDPSMRFCEVDMKYLSTPLTTYLSYRPPVHACCHIFCIRAW